MVISFVALSLSLHFSNIRRRRKKQASFLCSSSFCCNKEKRNIFQKLNKQTTVSVLILFRNGIGVSLF